MAGAIKISILANAANAVRGFRDTAAEAESTVGKIKGSFARMQGPALGVLGGIGAGMFQAGQAASELADTVSATNVIFGSASAAVEKFASDAAQNFGLSKQAALDAAGTFGTIGKSAGLQGPALSAFSNQFTGLAGDLASFKGGTAEEAVTAIGAAMRGEAEPIRRYGILLDDATLRAKALELGLIKTTKDALTPQQKALAASQVILAQSADAMGDFARTGDSAKNQQAKLKAELANVSAELGTALLPALATFASKLAEVVQWAERNQTTVKILVGVLGGLAALIVVVNAATAAWAAIQTVLNVVMAANPIGLVVLAIAALVAGIVLAYRNSETFRNIVQAAMRGVVAAFGWVVDSGKAVFGWLASAWDSVVDTFTGIGARIMHGLGAGIDSALGWIKSKVAGLGRLLPDWLRSVLGIHSPSRVMKGIGRNIVAGLGDGMTSQLSTLKRTVGAVSDTITGGIGGASVPGQTAIVTGSTGGANSYTVTVNVPPTADPAEVGRQVVNSIEAYERRSGRRRLAAA